MKLNSHRNAANDRNTIKRRKNIKCKKW